MTTGFDPTKPVTGSGLVSSDVRTNFQGDASNNFGATSPTGPLVGQFWIDSSNPANIKLMLYIDRGSGADWEVLFENLQDTVPQVFASQQRFEHDQASAAATWTVVHNLGYRPQFTVVDGGDNVIIPNTATYLDENRIQLTFAAALGHTGCPIQRQIRRRFATC